MIEIRITFIEMPYIWGIELKNGLYLNIFTLTVEFQQLIPILSTIHRHSLLRQFNSKKMGFDLTSTLQEDINLNYILLYGYGYLNTTSGIIWALYYVSQYPMNVGYY